MKDGKPEPTLPEGTEPNVPTKDGRARANAARRHVTKRRDGGWTSQSQRHPRGYGDDLSKDSNEGWTSQNQRCPKALNQKTQRRMDKPEPTLPEGTYPRDATKDGHARANDAQEATGSE